METIRLATAADAGPIADIYAPYVTSAVISFELTPPTAADMQQRLEATLRCAPWLVYVDDGEVLGYAYASKHGDRAAYQWSVNTSVYIRTGLHRRGIGRALYTSLFALLRLQGFYVACAGATLPNPGSVRLHESMGFRSVGVYRGVGYKLGAWRDVGWWTLQLREPDGEPAPPLSLSEAQAAPGWQAALAQGLRGIRS